MLVMYCEDGAATNRAAKQTTKYLARQYFNFFITAPVVHIGKVSTKITYVRKTKSRFTS